MVAGVCLLQDRPAAKGRQRPVANHANDRFDLRLRVQSVADSVAEFCRAGGAVRPFASGPILAATWRRDFESRSLLGGLTRRRILGDAR